MSDEFADSGPRPDLEDGFPAPAMEPRGPAFLGDSEAITSALVGVYVLQTISRSRGSRVGLAALESARARLEAAVTDEARNLCRDEASRTVAWLADPPPPTEEVLDRDRQVLADADQDSKVATVWWAIEQEMDVELEYYDEADERWPRLRATPLRVDTDEGPFIVVRTALTEISIEVANLRWLMPVERLDKEAPRVARVLSFPSFQEEE